MTAHPLAGHSSVEGSATRIRHYRYVEERMMRMLGGWIALTPELPAKLLMGRHVWDCAQHADLWGKRLPELRSPAQQSEPPGEAFVRLMDMLEGPEAFDQTPERLVGVYRVLKPCLLAAYQRHLGEANPVYEPPTRRILRRCIDEERRHIAAGEAVLRHLATTPELRRRAREWEERSRARLAETSGIAGDGMVPLAVPASPDDAPDVAQDLVELAKPVGRWPIPDDLARAVEAHGRAIVSRDLDALGRQVAAPARDAALPTYREVIGSPISDVAVVGCARVGNQWQIKQRLAGGEGVRVLQARWVLAEAGWHVAEVEVVRREPAG